MSSFRDQAGLGSHFQSFWAFSLHLGKAGWDAASLCPVGKSDARNVVSSFPSKSDAVPEPLANP